MTLLYTHESGIAHDPGPGHPERPERLKAVLKEITDAGGKAGRPERELAADTREQAAQPTSAANGAVVLPNPNAALYKE